MGKLAHSCGKRRGGISCSRILQEDDGRRMKRSLLNLAAAMSLVLFVLIGVFWAHSEMSTAPYGLRPPGTFRYWISSGDGVLVVRWVDKPLYRERLYDA